MAVSYSGWWKGFFDSSSLHFETITNISMNCIGFFLPLKQCLVDKIHHLKGFPPFLFRQLKTKL